MRDWPDEAYGCLAGAGLTVLYLVLLALPALALGQTALLIALAKGYAALWLAAVIGLFTASGLERAFRLDANDRFGGLVAVNLGVSGALTVAWSAVASAAVTQSLIGAAPLGVAALLAAGLVACYVGHAIIGAFFVGTLYQLVNLAIGAASYIAFLVWPDGARALFGWLLALVGT